MKTYGQLRRAFTLVELLVVMSLIAILATLAIAFFPSAASSQVEARAGTQVQSWLTIAKQRALRDQAPRGLRLWINNTSAYGGATLLNNVVTDCQYIEQPPDFPSNSAAANASVPGVTITSPTSAALAGAPGYNNLSCVVFSASSVGVLVNGASSVTLVQPKFQPATNPDPNLEYWVVQPGDFLEVGGTGLMHQIVQIGVPDGSPPTNPSTTSYVDFVVINPPLPYAITTTSNFRVVRAPRVTGDETLKMPESTVIDLNTNTAFAGYNNPLPWPTNLDNGSAQGVAAGFIDILFSPTGEVISPGVAGSNINLWVRSPSVDDPSVTQTSYFRGAPTIISVFTKTGFVGAYPPNSIGANPYSLIK